MSTSDLVLRGEVPAPPDLPDGASSSVNEYPAAAALERYRAELRVREADYETQVDGAIAKISTELEQATEEKRRAYADAYRERYWAIDDEFYGQLYEVVKGGINRARDSAGTVQKAAVSVATLYSIAVGVSFSVTENSLPLRGVIPLIFLGLAIVLSTVYLTWMGNHMIDVVSNKAESERKAPLRQRLYADEFTSLIAAMGRGRASFLRASVVALGLGLVFLPAPFVAVGADDSEAMLPPWPSASDFDGFQPDVGAALMEAQAAEVAKLREESRAAASHAGDSVRFEWLPEQGWMWSAIIGLLAVVGVLIKRVEFPRHLR